MRIAPCKGEDRTCKDEDRTCKDEDRTCKDEDRTCKDEDRTCKDEDRTCKDEDRTCKDEDRTRVGTIRRLPPHPLPLSHRGRGEILHHSGFGPPSPVLGEGVGG